MLIIKNRKNPVRKYRKNPFWNLVNTKKSKNPYTPMANNTCPEGKLSFLVKCSSCVIKLGSGLGLLTMALSTTLKTSTPTPELIKLRLSTFLFLKNKPKDIKTTIKPPYIVFTEADINFIQKSNQKGLKP